MDQFLIKSLNEIFLNYDCSLQENIQKNVAVGFFSIGIIKTAKIPLLYDPLIEMHL